MGSLFPVDEVVADLKKSIKEFMNEPDVFTHIVSFFHSIDWKEPLVLSLISSEVILFVVVWYFSRCLKFQAVLFVAIAICIYEAETLNAFCAKHWRLFSRQPYFDENGIFWSALISGPLLVLLLYILVNYLFEMMRLMIKVKKKQLILETQRRQESKKDS